MLAIALTIASTLALTLALTLAACNDAPEADETGHTDAYDASDDIIDIDSLPDSDSACGLLAGLCRYCPRNGSIYTRCLDVTEQQNESLCGATLAELGYGCRGEGDFPDFDEPDDDDAPQEGGDLIAEIRILGAVMGPGYPDGTPWDTDENAPEKIDDALFDAAADYLDAPAPDDVALVERYGNIPAPDITGIARLTTKSGDRILQSIDLPPNVDTFVPLFGDAAPFAPIALVGEPILEVELFDIDPLSPQTQSPAGTFTIDTDDLLTAAQYAVPVMLFAASDGTRPTILAINFSVILLAD